MITFGSVCSGIESVSIAVEPLGWQSAWFAEIEPFPSAVLAHHYPDITNHGDMTKLPGMVLRHEIPAPDVLVGGTPCQAFSVAGMRMGLEDERGQLTIKFVELADAIDHVRARRGEPECVVWWENVPGVLSDKGNAFGCFLAALVGESEPLEPTGKRWTNAGCVYGPTRSVAWRILDAQYFGLAQRRRRVFVVASARSGFDPAAVLFEREGVRRDTAPRREAGQNFTHDTAPCLVSSGRGVERTGDTRGQDPVVAVTAYGGGRTSGPLDVAACLVAKGQKCDFEVETFCVHGTQDPDICIGHAHPLGRNSGQENAVLSVALRGREGGATAELGDDVAGCLRASSGGGDKPHVLAPVCFPILEVGKRTGKSTTDPRAGLGIGGDQDPMYTLQAGAQHGVCVTGEVTAMAFTTEQTPKFNHECALTLTKQSPTGGGQIQSVMAGSAVRRLTPTECERLQGFPDNHTQIPWRGKPAEECPDGPRYKAIGNSKAVTVVRWIARRLQAQLNGVSP